MCIFTGNVNHVNSTRIFSRLDGGRQAIVYDMYLDTSEDTAMVLPAPINKESREHSVEFVDLSGYERIFEDLDDLFPASRAFAVGALATRGVGSAETLEVHEVGVYEASYVPSSKDFSRLDERFRVKEILFNEISEYIDYGFVAFKLKPGK